ncbi:MAG: hypothetical protein EAZ18_15915 [Oscillatoriales cyanobacterium]|nr:MAG: hypothetical protein EAZ18_15915 [Oscillatoriales cyanobacterium]
MRRIRIFALGIVSFFAVLMSALLAPGTFVNRALSAALCTVFSFNSTVCTVNLAQSGDRVVAATPPTVERNISDWLVQRAPGEFDDAPSVRPGSNPQAPPFPQDPGPKQPLRPDFDNPGSGQPTQPEKPQQLSSCSLTGTWVYSLYKAPSDQALLSSVTLEIKQEDGEISIGTSDTSLQNQQSISKLISAPVEKTTTETVENLKITQKTTAGGAVIYGDISEQKSGKTIFFVMERKTACVADHQPLSLAYPLLDVKVASLFENTMIALPKQSSINIPNSTKKPIIFAELPGNLTGEWSLSRTNFKVNFYIDDKKIVSPHPLGCKVAGELTEPITIIHRGYRREILDIKPIADNVGISGNIISSFREDPFDKDWPAIGANLKYDNIKVINDNLIAGDLICNANQGQAPYGQRANGKFTLTRISQPRDRIKVPVPEFTIEKWKEALPKRIVLNERQINVAANVITAVVAIGLAAAIVYAGPTLLAFLAANSTLVAQTATVLSVLGIVQVARSATIIGVPHKKDHVAQCGQQQVSGGQAGDTRTIQLTAKKGKINVSYEMFDVPDQLIVRYEGRVIINTGFVSDSSTVSADFDGNSDQVEVEVIGNRQQSSTKWNYTLSCPQ